MGRRKSQGPQEAAGRVRSQPPSAKREDEPVKGEPCADVLKPKGQGMRHYVPLWLKEVGSKEQVHRGAGGKDLRACEKAALRHLESRVEAIECPERDRCVEMLRGRVDAKPDVKLFFTPRDREILEAYYQVVRSRRHSHLTTPPFPVKRSNKLSSSDEESSEAEEAKYTAGSAAGSAAGKAASWGWAEAIEQTKTTRTIESLVEEVGKLREELQRASEQYSALQCENAKLIEENAAVKHENHGLRAHVFSNELLHELGGMACPDNYEPMREKAVAVSDVEPTPLEDAVPGSPVSEPCADPGEMMLDAFSWLASEPSNGRHSSPGAARHTGGGARAPARSCANSAASSRAASPTLFPPLPPSKASATSANPSAVSSAVSSAASCPAPSTRNKRAHEEPPYASPRRSSRRLHS